MLTYVSYGLYATGIVTTFGGIYSLEGNIGNHQIETRNSHIIIAGFSFGIFTGLVAGLLGKNYEIRHRNRYRLIFWGKQLEVIDE